MKSSPTPVDRMDTYLIFNTPIRSQIALPELPRCAECEPAITIRRDALEPQDEAGFTPRHDWRRDGGPIICSSARRGSQYRLSFPGRASFHIRPGEALDMPSGGNESIGDTISCSASPGADEDVMRQLLLSQVIPRYLAHRGALLLHASAVTLPTGKTVAFLGESGQGKSTLASYCGQQGAQLIDDDCLLLHIERDCVSVVGGVPAIRLYPDSLHALGLRAPGLRAPQHTPAAMLPGMEVLGLHKQELSLHGGSIAHQRPRVLDALLLLDQPGEPPDDTAVRLQPASGQAAMMALLHGAFHLDPSDTATMPRVFSQAAAVLNGSPALPVYHLYYPRQHDRLPDVLQSVLNFQPR
jgi:hypothetical protein